MKDLKAVYLAAILLCIGFGGGWFARSQKAETPRFYVSRHQQRTEMLRYDPETDRFVIYGQSLAGHGSQYFLGPLHVRARRLDDAHRSK